MSHDYIAVDIARNVYQCESCGRWKEEMSLSLYTPIDLENVLNEYCGNKTIREWGYIPCMFSRELERDFMLIKEYPHKCRKCKKIMRRMGENELISMSCPRCRTENIAYANVFAD